MASAASSLFILIFVCKHAFNNIEFLQTPQLNTHMKGPTSPIFFPPSSPLIPHDDHKYQLPTFFIAKDNSITTQTPTQFTHKFHLPKNFPKRKWKQLIQKQPTFTKERQKKKKMKLPSIFKNRETKHPLSRQWPSCKNPKTLSFRKDDDMFKTVNSVYFDPLDIGIGEAQESWFTNSSESASFSTESEENSGEDPLETIVRGVRSERLFFEPAGGTSSILEETDQKSCVEISPLKESVALAMESDDPYLDFKRSMQEMVETNGLKDWESLEELLGWYLKMNGKMNHGFIVGAFVDLLLGLASSSSSDDSSFLSASSSFSSPSCSPLSPFGQKEINIGESNNSSAASSHMS